MYVSNGISPLGTSIKTVPNGAHTASRHNSVSATSRNVFKMLSVYIHFLNIIRHFKQFRCSFLLAKCLIVLFPEELGEYRQKSNFYCSLKKRIVHYLFTIYISIMQISHYTNSVPITIMAAGETICFLHKVIKKNIIFVNMEQQQGS